MSAGLFDRRTNINLVKLKNIEFDFYKLKIV